MADVYHKNLTGTDLHDAKAGTIATMLTDHNVSAHNALNIDADKVDACHAGIATGNVFKIPAGIAQGDIFYVDGSGNIVRLSYGTSGHFLKTQGAAANPVWAAGAGGVTTWLALTDTPGAFTGQAGMLPRVNNSETALEFKDNAIPTTFVVAANDAKDKLRSDYDCDASADQTEINNAINTLPT